jgi:hypothetical protein
MKAMRGAFIDHLLELGCIGARWIITERRESMFEAFSDCTADMFALHVKQPNGRVKSLPIHKDKLFMER